MICPVWRITRLSSSAAAASLDINRACSMVALPNSTLHAILTPPKAFILILLLPSLRRSLATTCHFPDKLLSRNMLFLSSNPRSQPIQRRHQRPRCGRCRHLRLQNLFAPHLAPVDLLV